MLATRTFLQQEFYSPLNWRDLCLKLRANYLPITHPVPEFEYFFNLFQ
jgi:hypothetical protein